jgi:hypothetical protein
MLHNATGLNAVHLTTKITKIDPSSILQKNEIIYSQQLRIIMFWGMFYKTYDNEVFKLYICHYRPLLS